MSSDLAAGRFWVYVIEIDATHLGDVGSGALYVGSTANTPEYRFAQHAAAGPKAARVFKKGHRAVALRPTLVPSEGPFDSRQQAERFERKTVNRLKARGYAVWSDKGGRSAVPGVPEVTTI